MESSSALPLNLACIHVLHHLLIPALLLLRFSGVAEAQLLTGETYLNGPLNSEQTATHSEGWLYVTAESGVFPLESGRLALLRKDSDFGYPLVIGYEPQ